MFREKNPLEDEPKEKNKLPERKPEKPEIIDAHVTSTGSGFCDINFVDRQGNVRMVTIKRERKSMNTEDYEYKLLVDSGGARLDTEDKKMLIELTQQRLDALKKDEKPYWKR